MAAVIFMGSEARVTHTTPIEQWTWPYQDPAVTLAKKFTGRHRSGLFNRISMLYMKSGMMLTLGRSRITSS